MELLTAWPDAEDVGLALLEPAGDVRLQTPVDLTLPLIVVRKVGGTDNGITDAPRLEVQVFASSRVAARDLAEQCRQLALAAPATQVAGVSIDFAATETSPTFVDYGIRDVHRYVATYRLEYRRPRH